MASEEKKMADLHKAVAEELLRRVLSGDATSADLNVARGFLKDNGIDAGLEQSDPMANLAKSLPFNIDMKEGVA
jgi:hypothetical protein|tara:strand:- start:8 stop:229 length:222 start_codon:yes stop_codon:yes gene_type:complete